MEQSHGFTVDRAQLIGAVRGVRLRWKLRRAMLGAAITIAGALVVLVALAYILRALDYGDTAVIVGQSIAVATVLGLAWWAIVRPLLPNPSDEQMALFIEEREPSLDATLLTAVELDRDERTSGSLGRSPALASRLFHVARERIRKLDDGRRVDRAAMQQSAGALGIVALIAFAATLLGPPVLRHGLKLLLTPWDREQPASLYAINVEPGDATVARGGDQLVHATLYGFQSDSVDLLVKRADSTGWVRVPMARDSSGKWAFRLLDVVGAMDYLVESNGVRSRGFHIAVADLPYVKSLRLEYRYPEYTQIPPRVVEEGGDIVALAGTRVRVRVTPTLPATGGRIVLDNGDTVALARADDGTLSGTVRVMRPGFYKVQLRSNDGRLVPASLDYAIDVLSDRPPTISFTKPGADRKVLAVDEVYSEAKAEDDYGIAKMDLVFSVNGGAERTVKLHENTGKVLTDLAAGYTFMLEEYELQPGDLVSYYARATDNNQVTGAQTATTDIYFLQVRPYAQDYRQQQGGGGGGQGQQGDQQNQLSETQRQIIAGTFKTQRDRAVTPPKEQEENMATLRLSQQRLREQVEELARRLVQRGIAASDSNYDKIAKILPQAAKEMDEAEKILAQNDAQKALSPEQRALQHLLRAEAVYREIQISQGGGGGGGGGGGSSAQDLADLFELQQDKLRNQYESVQRGQQQQQEQQNAKIDETLERLKQLAARQQQENERAQRKMDSLRLGQSGSGGGGAQRQMAQEAERAARQLERLARERESRELADAARRLQEAADAMRRAAASGQQGSAEGRNALDQLREARRLLDQERRNSAGGSVQDALRTARQLAEQERQVQEEMKRLENAQDRAERTRALADRKGEMADQVRQLKSNLDRMALDSRRDQKETSEKLAEAAQGMRDNKLEERLRASQQAVRFTSPEYAQAMENEIGAGISQLGRQLEEAARRAEQGAQQGDRQAQALDRTRDLVEGVQSLAERMEERSREQSRRLGAGNEQGEESRNQGAQRGDSAGSRGQRNGAEQGRESQSGQSGQNAGRQAQSGQSGQNAGREGQNGQSGQNAGQQSQSGQNAGQQSQSGQNAGRQPRNGQGGQLSGPNGNGGRLSPQDAQQFGREMRERLADAEALRRDLARQGVDVSELDRAISQLRSLANEGLVGDADAATRLKSQVVEGLKGFEFDLRRALGGDEKDRVLLGRSGDVPEGYRQAVEEYYRSLAAGKKKP